MAGGPRGSSCLHQFLLSGLTLTLTGQTFESSSLTAGPSSVCPHWHAHHWILTHVCLPPHRAGSCVEKACDWVCPGGSAPVTIPETLPCRGVRRKELNFMKHYALGHDHQMKWTCPLSLPQGSASPDPHDRAQSSSTASPAQ